MICFNLWFSLCWRDCFWLFSFVHRSRDLCPKHKIEPYYWGSAVCPLHHGVSEEPWRLHIYNFHTWCKSAAAILCHSYTMSAAETKGRGKATVFAVINLTPNRLIYLLLFRILVFNFVEVPFVLNSSAFIARHGI